MNTNILRRRSHTEGRRKNKHKTEAGRGVVRVRWTSGVGQVLGVKDKAGICHQLADNARLKWVP